MDKEFQRIVQLFQTFSHPWAVCGGWAIDLFVGHATRHHKDVDIAVFRDDQLAVQSFLLGRGWHLQKVVNKTLANWESSEYLTLPTHNIWCNHPDWSPNYLEVLFSDTQDEQFCFRKDISIRRPINQTFIMSKAGIPILAPEIVLLYKSHSLDKPEYQQDFEVTLPLLNSAQRTWLKQTLERFHGEHLWLDIL